MLVFGDEGYPLILFPTLMGRYYESKDRRLTDAVSWFVDQELVRIYCGHNEHFSGIFAAKNISHWLDIQPNARHGWPIWKEMLPHYLSLIK